MAMCMQEFFYEEIDPAYFVQYGRQSFIPYSHAYQIQLPERRNRRLEMSTFDLAVPMCCAQCEDEVRDALLALGNVHDVLCDPRHQRVSVTGCVDPAQALKQVRRVKSDATFWRSSGSAYSAQRYEVASHPSVHRYVQQDGSDRRWYGQVDARESERPHSRQSSNGGSRDEYTRSLCPAYRDSTMTHYVSVNPTIATRVEVDC